MSFLLTMAALAFAIASVVFIKRKLSGLMVVLATAASMAPLIDHLPVQYSFSIVALYMCFAIVVLNQEVWVRFKFSAVVTSRFRLVLVALSLTLGVSVSVWWWQDSARLNLDALGEFSNWWKVIITSVVALNFLIKLGPLKKTMGDRDE